jgi:hypothetical protein
MRSHLLPLATLAATVAAHGYVSSPTARQWGNAAIAACGQSVVNSIRADNTSHVEGLPELAAADSGYNASLCNLWLCRGLQFADNVQNVQSYAPGQEIEIKVLLTIPHTGNANVSVVNTKSNAVIGKPLAYWAAGYANEAEFYSKTLPANQTDFKITIPTNLGSQCAEAGSCVSRNLYFVESSY